MAHEALIAELLRLPRAVRMRRLRGFDEEQRRALQWHWRLWAREAQIAPEGDWRLWLVMAGRGFGKTRAGAEWVREAAEHDPQARIALVGATLAEARSVMVEGESGVLAVSPPGMGPVFEPSLRRLSWPNGAQATLYSALEPESLRGPQQSHAWCDEIGKWDHAGGRAERAWDNLRLGLRLGAAPRTLATTTPRAVPLLQRLLAEPGAVRSGGPTEENCEYLPDDFIEAMRAAYGGSLLARQELDGVLVLDRPGALWSRSLLERCREAGPDPRAPRQARGEGDPGIRRMVVAVDPPAGTQGDACGIVVAALYADGIARVLADCSTEGASPEQWARAVAGAAQHWQADRVVAEANQGGAMVASVLRAADCALPLRLVHASRGKTARAEPVAALYEAGKVRHHGMFARLEDQLCGLLPGGRYEGPGRSPDRADALVWALSELMLARRAEPRVLTF